MPTPRYEDYAIILSADHEVLLVDDRLPCVTSNQPHFWQNCEIVNRAIRDQYGIAVTTASCLKVKYSDNMVTGIYLLEYHGGRLPANTRWLKRSALPDLAPPVAAGDIRHWLAWFEGDHPLRLPWLRADYFKMMADSLKTQLGQTVTVEQVRTWERSYILRIYTETNTLYHKTIPPMFRHEPALADWLYRHSPDQFPAVQGVEPQHSFVMAAYEGIPLMEQPDLLLWQRALSEYARLQVDCVSQVDELLALGVPARGLDWIDAHIDALISSDSLARGTMPLTAQQISDLRALTPRLHDACEALANFDIPLSLEHGDLWTGQIIVRSDGGFVFTDWSDSAITHPFFSPPYFVAELDNELPGLPNARTDLRDAYLSAWTDFEPMPRLLEAYEYARLLSPLYTALQYHFDWLPNMEIQWEMENMLAYNLRLLLKAASVTHPL